jgi:hypothetical protein
MIDIDALKRDKRPQSSTIVHALIDRLEAAESEAIEQARLNGMGSEREAALMAKLEAAEKERDAAELMSLALQAKIEQMERQEPVAEIGQQYTLLFAGSGPITGLVKRHGLKIGDKLYALPGAQPAPSVPEGWKLVPVEPTQEMINHVIKERLEALVAWKEHTFIDIYKAMLAAAAAPEAKP